MNSNEKWIKLLTWETLTGNIRIRLYEIVTLKWDLIVDTISDLARIELVDPKWLDCPDNKYRE